MNDIIILIIDDDQNICDYLKRRLESLGCTIEVAYTLTEGLSLMAEIKPPPSFVFLDLHFPRTVNSPEVRAQDTLACIPKFHEINPKVSVVIITGLINEKIQQMANTLGAAFRQKPDLHTQEDVWKSIEEAIKLGEEHGIEPYETTTKILARITELREGTSVKALT